MFHNIDFDEGFFVFNFQRSEEKDDEVSSNDIKTGDCLINTIEQVIFFLSKRSLSRHKHSL